MKSRPINQRCECIRHKDFKIGNCYLCIKDEDNGYKDGIFYINKENIYAWGKRKDTNFRMGPLAFPPNYHFKKMTGRVRIDFANGSYEIFENKY